ncbi:hypothetical protein VTO42DRAFT_1979 [Malbranchea cinnamomea]
MGDIPVESMPEIRAVDTVHDDAAATHLLDQLASAVFGEFDADSSQSHSNTCTTPEPCPSRSNNASEKEAFLDDLNHFVPVGVLRQYDGSIAGVDSADHPHAELEKLENHGWVRTFVRKNELYPGWSSVQLYVLPEDTGRKLVPRSNTALRRALKLVMSKLDASPEAWEGRFDPTSKFEKGPENEDESLFYIFNTLESPEPDPDAVSDPWARSAMEDLLWKGCEDSSESDQSIGILGLKTPLYAYQRRSAAFMLQKESEPGVSLDPRLQCFEGPTGQQYYYDKEEGTLVREKRLYSNARGGVLAETMGFGKTLICLALILATRGYFPRIPSDYLQDTHPVRRSTGSLLEMAASTAGRLSVPWKRYFDDLEAEGMDFRRCRETCERNRGMYTQSTRSIRGRVSSTNVRLCSGTIVVVPANLVGHWLHEIDKHTQGLKVLVLRDGRTPTPPADELLKYDIVLFSKPRFDKEAMMFLDSAQRVPYESPLRELHWLRIIVDEGHNFASSGQKTRAVHLLDRLQVERRWVVSGTPSNGLYGIEVALASQETSRESHVSEEDKASAILQNRKDASKILDEELKNLDKLRRIVVDFLGMKPWSNSRVNDPASWGKYIKPIGTNGRRRMSPSLRPILQSIFVRHRAEHINRELVLPKLHNRVVYLEPTFYDRLSLNLFIFQLTVNAITSERTDEDYMFHPKNRKHLSLLINNLRHAGFWWTGFKREDLEHSLTVAKKYMEKNLSRMSTSDLLMLTKAIDVGTKALECRSWNVLSEFDDLGIFVHDFPEHARTMWSIDDLQEHQQPLLLGIFEAKLAQQFVTSRLDTPDPSEGIAGAGIRAKRQRKEGLGAFKPVAERVSTGNKPSDYQIVPRAPLDSVQKATTFSSKTKHLPPDSPLARAKTVATTSAKLTYLMEQVLEFHETEKIIIFYDHDNIGFWIAEGLDILGVEFRIYAKSLKMELKNKWLSLFNEGESVRVLLMDLRQASHGLHLACASRVYIVNPIWDPNMESQAIKRSHRISQTKPVYVKTLVLKDTLEDRMLRRRKEMTSAELQHAERDPLDDRTMSYIIQTEDFLPITEDEVSAIPAYLKNPPGFFDRHTLPVPDDSSFPPIPSPVLTSPLPAFLGFSKALGSHSPNPPPLKGANSTPRKTGKNRDFADDEIPWIDSDLSGCVTPSRKRPRKSRAE